MWQGPSQRVEPVPAVGRARSRSAAQRSAARNRPPAGPLVPVPSPAAAHRSSTAPCCPARPPARPPAAQASEQDLWGLFAPAGDILELAILRSQGRSKGCAFLTYATRAQVRGGVGAGVWGRACGAGARRPAPVLGAREGSGCWPAGWLCVLEKPMLAGLCVCCAAAFDHMPSLPASAPCKPA